MYPWLWLWAPQVQLPWSGDVTQRIDQTTHWFFQGIRPGSGHARIEEQAFDVASYGKQLGLISELLLDLTEPVQNALPPKAAQARRELQRIAARSRPSSSASTGSTRSGWSASCAKRGAAEAPISRGWRRA
jgi:hypothetical protein